MAEITVLNWISFATGFTNREMLPVNEIKKSDEWEKVDRRFNLYEKLFKPIKRFVRGEVRQKR